jgi:hypothetical protein
VIILSGVLVVVAIALLIAGIVTGNSGTEVVGLDGLNLIYISIGVSIVSALFLAIGVFLRRKDLFGPPADSSAGPAARTGKRGKRDKGRGEQTAATAATASGRPEEAGATPDRPIAGRAADADTADLPAVLPPAADVPAAAVVYVVPGRRRYHIDGCRHLTGRDQQELTFAEAREEGFSPCTACMPDTALAARAVSGGPATDRPSAAESTGSTAGGRPDSGPDTSFGTNGSTASATSAAVGQPAGPSGAGDNEAGTPAGETAAPADRPASADDDAADSAGGAGEPRPGNPAPAPAADVPPQAAGDDDKDRNGGPQVRILSGTKRYHRPDCALIEDIGEGADDLESLTRAEAKARGCTPCLVCQPDKEPATRD